MHWMFLIFLSFISCSGYKFTKRTNPLEQYGIKKLAVPAFYNKSSLAHVSPEFTKEIITMLRQFPGLEVQNFNSDEADAVLIGIIESSDKYKEVVTNEDYRVTSDVAPQSISINSRKDFYIPAITNVNLNIRFVLIKHPDTKEIELLMSDLGKQLKANSKILFNQVITVNGKFNREILDGEARSVNATQNRGAMSRTITSMALTAKNGFKELILYAF